ncbi:MAG: DUF4070 domain-containing protein [Patescibacteria group bacterium]|nr:DUF4070 domain-containing protein [Patescibacteria group bacterium]
MKILLVYPKCPDTFWGFKWALRFVSKKSAFPPLGLLTVAAMLPKAWSKKLVDANVRRLRDKDIAWADMIFLSAMIIQKDGAREIIQRCKNLGKIVVAGGPLFSAGYENFPNVDYFVLNEAEITFPLFLKDLAEGKLQKIYSSAEKPDLSLTPIPDWSLIKLRHYSAMLVQYSRGCPHSCEFCDIAIMYGKKLRVKTTPRIIAELEALLAAGWRGSIFFVDDNFIGNRFRVKEMLPVLIAWQEARNYPFNFFTEASVDLADDEELLAMMSRANFNKVFLGIETTNVASLMECNKKQNINRDLAESVKKIQHAGLEVMAGFIVGFDNDTPKVFDSLLSFIQETGVVTAMVGMLNVLPKTKLWDRLQAENRLAGDAKGDPVSRSVNFIPVMGKQALVDGYLKLLGEIYSSKNYYQRIGEFLRSYKPTCKGRVSFSEFKAFLRSLWRIGIFSRSNWRYSKLLVKTFFTKRGAFSAVVVLAIQGVHFQHLAKKLKLA